MRILQKLLLPALFLLVAVLYLIRSQAYEGFAAGLSDEPAVTVSGNVKERQVKEDYCSYKITGASFELDGKTVQGKTLLLYADDDSIPLGSTIIASGTIAAFSHASNEGAFDSYSYYKSMAVSARISVDTIEITKNARLPWREGLRTLRDSIRSVFEECLNTDDAGVLSAMVLGDKTLLEQDVKQTYQDMGISHILAISGLHISILGMGLYRMLRKKLYLPYPVCCVISAVILFLFCTMSGFSVSTQRAFFSFLFYLGAEYSGRTYTTLRALLLSAVCILLRNPLAVTQTGFQLSYSALLSIQCFVPLIHGLFSAAEYGSGFVQAMHTGLRNKSAEKTARDKGYAQTPQEPHTFCSRTENDRSFSCVRTNKTRFDLTRLKLLKLPVSFLKSFPESIPVSAAVWLGMLPLTAYFFYQIPLFSVLLNMLILPLCGVLLGVSLLGGIAGIFIPVAGQWLLTISRGILSLFDLEMGFFSGISGSSASGAWICGRSPLWFVVVFYLVFFSLCLFLQNREAVRDFLEDHGFHAAARRLRERNRSDNGLSEVTIEGFCARKSGYPDVGRGSAGVYTKGTAGPRVRSRSRHRVNLFLAGRRALPALILLSLAAADLCVLLRPVGTSFAVKMLDVGQGDGICITSSDGTCIMIDGGSTSQENVGTYQILPFLKYNAIRSVDIWLVSHTDEDHISGILEVLAYGYEVDVLAFSNLPEDDEAYVSLCTAAAANGTRVAYVCEGSSISTSDFTMTCLYPAADDVSDDANNLSQVWLLEQEDLSMLFTGDLGSEQEAIIIERGLLPEVDILKVGHHGSKNSTSEDFLEALSPAAALISVGENNLYGHPSPETLGRLADQGIASFATMDYGQLTVRAVNGQIRITGFLSD